MEPKYDKSQTKQYTTVNKQTKNQQIPLNEFWLQIQHGKTKQNSNSTNRPAK